ncbi:MAG: hypothetical protein CBC48_16645 [bacterium TMED88]|nr:hypothetical protein [Deltaproteobacteria bacterium]OUV25261.1 MAG: hypothetical protein CBC48_16645 [bacterium TMED88]
MGDRLQLLSGQNWQDFIAASAAVLILGKSDCAHCNEWSKELEEALQSSSFHPNVRFGKLLLDQPGLISFKRANPWIADLDVLPYNLIYQDGESLKEWAGGGLDRLNNRLNRVFGETEKSASEPPPA